MRYVDVLDLVELEQLLLVSEHFLEEVLVHHFRRRDIQLNYTEYDQ